MVFNLKTFTKKDYVKVLNPCIAEHPASQQGHSVKMPLSLRMARLKLKILKAKIRTQKELAFDAHQNVIKCHSAAAGAAFCCLNFPCVQHARLARSPKQTSEERSNRCIAEDNGGHGQDQHGKIQD